VTIRANANFQSLTGTSPHQSDSHRYREYRRAWMENPAGFILADFPLHLDVEASCRCNLRCVFCDKLPALKGLVQGDMDFGLWRTIIAEAGRNGLYGLKLSYRGEPLLHPRLPEMVAMAKDAGILDIYFNTNGMLLSQETARALIDAKLDRISVSVEGTDPAAFERARRGADFARIEANIRGLVELRERLGAATPKVRVQTVRLPGLDLEAYAAYWGQRADEVAVVDYKDGGNRVTGVEHAGFACPQPWQRMTITWDGLVLPCNNDDDLVMPLGRIPERSIGQCWSDARLMELRGLHRRGLSHLAGPCDGCPWRTAQIAKLGKIEPSGTGRQAQGDPCD